MGANNGPQMSDDDEKCFRQMFDKNTLRIDKGGKLFQATIDKCRKERYVGNMYCQNCFKERCELKFESKYDSDSRDYKKCKLQWRYVYHHEFLSCKSPDLFPMHFKFI
jgi:hypothetical protein